ncbi:DUF2063 domain-containing protein, partial [Burkholderia pseudomallei]
PVTSRHSAEAEDARVTRRAHAVIVSRLPLGGAVVLISLIDGASLGDAVAFTLDDNPALVLPAGLRGMMEAGVVSAILSGG